MPFKVLLPVRESEGPMAFWLLLERQIEAATDADALLDLRIAAANRSLEHPGEYYWFQVMIEKADARLSRL